MATYGDMQDRIADELHRSDLTARIQKAILSAVAHYERRRFYFSETSFTFATVAGQEVYTSADAAAIATSPYLERLNGSFSGTRTPINKVHWQEIDNKSATTSSRGQPDEWAYRAKSIRFHPIPDAAYTITAYSVPRLTALSSVSDTNAWTEDAEELIRTRAKIDLIENQIGIAGRMPELTTMKQREHEALRALVVETASREAVGHLIPTEF